MIMLANWLSRGEPAAEWLCILLKWWIELLIDLRVSVTNFNEPKIALNIRKKILSIPTIRCNLSIVTDGEKTIKCIEIRYTDRREGELKRCRASNMLAVVNHRDGCPSGLPYAKPVHSDVRWDCDEETNKHTSPSATHSRVHHTPNSKFWVVTNVAEEFLQRAKAQHLPPEQSFLPNLWRIKYFGYDLERE